MSVVEFKDVVKKFGAKTVLDGVSFSIKPGSVFALLGENGAGKTTTIRMILGETAPTSGRVRVFEQEPFKHSKEVRERIGFIPKLPALQQRGVATSFLGLFHMGNLPRRRPCRNFEIFCIFLETNSDAALYEGEPTTSVVDAYRLKIRGERYV